MELAGMTARDGRDTSSVNLAGVDISKVGFRKAVGWIVRRVNNGRGGYVCTPNVDFLVRANRDPEFRRAVQGADLRVPDGMWIVYGSWIAGRPLHSTVTGRLLPESVGRALAEKGESIALFGARPGVAEEAARTLRRRGVIVAEAFGPSMRFVVGSDEDRDAMARLADSQARVIFVALGNPKQELWMERHAAELPDRVLVGVGAAFDILAGRIRGAPQWVTAIGMEWAFRLAQEPRRLYRRYLWDDPRFLLWMLQVRFGREPRPRT
jgi:N-acetylglucosaminyldiphosphoundecaprenol N-acetyl-beta-D-mannosaminyltransferase